MAYPDKINALVDVTADQTLAEGGHAARHNDVNDALDELEAVFTAPAANELALRPDGSTEAVRIDSAGKVQIGGTAAEAASLYVEHDQDRVVYIKQTDTSLSNDTYSLDVDSASQVSNMSSAGAFRVKTFYGDSLRVTGVGAVVIGDSVRSASNVHGDLVLSGSLFLGGTGTANELDDYEEGTFTPTYTASISNFSSVTYDAQDGLYTKIGRMVYISIRIRTDAVSGGSGTVRIAGLPFTVSNLSGNANWSAMSIGIVSGFSGEHPISVVATENADSVTLYYRTAVDGATTTLAAGDLGTSTNSNDLYLAGFYFTA